MPIKVSKKIKSELPANEKKDIEKWLEAKAWETCFLCERPIDVEKDELVADHDDAKTTGGASVRDNLNLTHSVCNKRKQGLTTRQARAIIQIEDFLTDRGPDTKYGEVLSYFGIEPCPILVDSKNDQLIVDFGVWKSTVPIYSETNIEGKPFRYAFIEVPRSAIYNDDECQPRPIKRGQLRKLYLDLDKNPLHEPPSCRLDLIDAAKRSHRLLMFDGQHKTTACWMQHRDSVVVKVYVDLALNDAITLVTSIQGEIPKLPLEKFELIYRLDKVFLAMFEAYSAATDPAEVSEAGSIVSVDFAERDKAKKALDAAVIKNIIDDGNLLLYTRSVQGVGLRQGEKKLTQAAFQNKVLRKLIYKKALTVPIRKGGQEMRDREKEHITRALNYLARNAFGAGSTEPLGAQEAERARRMSYQSSLQYISGLIFRAFENRLTPMKQEHTLMERDPTEEQWKILEADIQRIINHPVWTTPWKKSANLKQLEDALSKNQNAETSFQKLHLTPSYVVDLEKLQGDWYED